MSVELDDFIGKEYLLTGVDKERIPNPNYDEDRYYEDETLNVIRFVLDDVIYQVEENPDDGWRSSMRDIKVIDTNIQNRFGSVTVKAQWMAHSDYVENYVVEFVDVLSNKVVLSVGTGNWNDWYPYFVDRWEPQNLYVNRDMVK